VRLLPVVAFGLIGLVFLDKSLRSGARRTWAWGRTGEGAPLSRVSYAVWAITFFSIAFTLSRAPQPGLGAVFAIALCFGAVVVMGFLDTRADRKSVRGANRR
jgi:preprotein translocase subunit SecG